MPSSKAEIFMLMACPAADQEKRNTGTLPPPIEKLIGQLGLKLSGFHRDVLKRLLRSPMSLSHLDSLLATSEKSIAPLQSTLQQLAFVGYLRLATAARRPIATLTPISSQFAFSFPPIKKNTTYRLSRFAYIRRHESGELILETSTGFAHIFFHDAASLATLQALAAGSTAKDLATALQTARHQGGALLRLLLSGGFVEECIDGKFLSEDADTALYQWEFHDLLFHTRSRCGRHNYPMGGTIPFIGKIAPEPAVKKVQNDLGQIALFQPDLDKLVRFDPPFTRVLESRSSDRIHDNTNPLELKTLGEFLFRTARVKTVFQQEGFIGSFTKRPYPSAGSLYEIEMYLMVNNCQGLHRGCYYYAALAHELVKIAKPNCDFEELLNNARQACRLTDGPQILVVLAARFQRVSWKYRGIAYSLMLKNVGVLYGTMHLVASAMNLAFCAIGSGNSDQFSKVTGTDYYKESSIGEFILGNRAKSEKPSDLGPPELTHG